MNTDDATIDKTSDDAVDIDVDDVHVHIHGHDPKGGGKPSLARVPETHE